MLCVRVRDFRDSVLGPQVSGREKPRKGINIADDGLAHETHRVQCTSSGLCVPDPAGVRKDDRYEAQIGRVAHGWLDTYFQSDSDDRDAEDVAVLERVGQRSAF